MKAVLKFFLLPLLTPTLLAQRPWQEVTVPSVSEAAANFKSPPHEYGAIQPFASWNGADPAEVKARMSRDFDRLAANGVFIVNLSPGRRAPGEGKYLSPEHMDIFKSHAVAEAAKRNMRLWIQDESDYPSGFAGGYITERYPQLGMQDIVADIQVKVAPGQTLTMPVPPDTLAIWATETDANQQIKQVISIPVPADLQLKYLVPAEGTTPNEPRYNWQIQFLRHVYLSSPTRNFNRADGTRAKDATYTIIDYLDPKATDAYLHTVHETYFGAVGDQFGKTVLGFFGDEPDYSSGIPWTPRLLEEFKARKGYDLAPYLPSWFDRKPIAGSELARADYYDVWSAIFKDSFFGRQADWAKAHNVEYLVHLNHEETMLSLERSEGRLLSRQPLRRGSGNRQPNPARPQPRPCPRWRLEHQQQLPQAGFFGGASLRPPTGLGGRRRRRGRRWQVPDGLPARPRRQRARNPRPRPPRRRWGWRCCCAYG